MHRTISPVLTVAAAMIWAHIASAQAPAVPFLDDSTVQTINLSVDPVDWSLLEQYYELNTYYHATFTWNGITENIGIRQHGHGSRSGIKPNLDLNFAKYDSTQTFLGLGFVVIRANNEDPSNLRDWLAMKLYRKMGIPAPREAPAQVFVNGQLLGFYYIVEHMDGNFAQRNYGESDGYLYEWESLNNYDFANLGTDPSKYAAFLSLKTNQAEPDLQNFVSLVQAINRPWTNRRDDDFVSALSRYVDPKQFLLYAAVDQTLAETDGLIGGQQGMNNVDLYQFQGSTLYNFIPWDEETSLNWATMDVMNGIYASPNLTTNINLLAARLVAIPQYAQVYLAALTKAANVMGGTGGFLDSALTWEYNIIYNAAMDDPYKQCATNGVMGSCPVENFVTTVVDIHSLFTVRSAFVLAQAIAYGYQPSTDSPQVAADGVVAYGGAQAVSPGGLTNVSATNLSATASPNSGAPLPRIIGNTFVTVDGVRAPLLSTSSGSIAFQVPGDISPTGIANIVVFNNSDYSATQEITVQAATPSITSVLHQDGSSVSIASPVISGETLTVYATGLGAVNGALPLGYAPTDASSTTMTTPQILLGGQPLTVTYSGLAQGAVGLYQVNAVAPSNLSGGSSLAFVLSDSGQTAPWIPQ
jgi:uncharacterized protein (TIGR03437 family)